MARQPLLNIRLDSETKADWERAASEEDVSLSEFVRRCVAERPTISGAHRLVARAINLGILVRPKSCEECGKEAKIDAAHSDYGFPLDVNWLCRSCHRKWDANDPKGKTALDKAVSVRFPDELLELVAARAKAEHRSFNAQILVLLERALGLSRASEVLPAKPLEADPRGIDRSARTIAPPPATKRTFAPDFK